MNVSLNMDKYEFRSNVSISYAWISCNMYTNECANILNLFFLDTVTIDRMITALQELQTKMMLRTEPELHSSSLRTEAAMRNP